MATLPLVSYLHNDDKMTLISVSFKLMKDVLLYFAVSTIIKYR